MTYRFPNGEEPCCLRYAEDQCGVCSGFWTATDWNDYQDAMRAGGASEEVIHRAWHRWWYGDRAVNKRIPECTDCYPPLRVIS